MFLNVFSILIVLTVYLHAYLDDFLRNKPQTLIIYLLIIKVKIGIISYNNSYL